MQQRPSTDRRSVNCVGHCIIVRCMHMMYAYDIAADVRRFRMHISVCAFGSTHTHRQRSRPRKLPVSKRVPGQPGLRNYRFRWPVLCTRFGRRRRVAGRCRTLSTHQPHA